MKRALRHWIAFWDEREPATSLALTRILVGLALLGDLLQAAFSGAAEASFAPPPFGVGWGAPSAPPLAIGLLGASTHTTNALFALALFSGALFTLGALFRVSALTFTFALTELALCAPSGDRGIDKLLRLVVLVLALSPAHERWSVHAWRARRRGAEACRPVPAWARRLLFLQLTWVYFSAAHNRGDLAWWPFGGFSAVARILGDPHMARFTPGWQGTIYPLTQLMTAATMWFETTSPLLMPFTWLARRPGRGGAWGERVRRWQLRWLWIALGASLHLGIALTMRLGMFPYGMLALYPLLFHPSELERAADWLGTQLKAKRAQPPEVLSFGSSSQSEKRVP